MEPLRHYVVTWTIDIWADTPHDAAIIALEIQRDSMSDATIFEVKTVDEDTTETVDLLLEDLQGLL